MKIVFMGTPEFAVPSLVKIYNSFHDVVTVVTGPDKPAGRGKKLKPTPVKRYAQEFNIPILTPEKLSAENFIGELLELNADLFVVVAFRILPKSVFTIPHFGTINLHASLLPKYRGAAPINWAIINGEKESGVTTFFIEEKVDTGEWIFQKKVTIGEKETAGELHDKLTIIGAEVLLGTVNAIEQGKAPRIKQQGEITKAPKLTRDLCYINWERDANSINNLIRGLAPFPRAFSYLKKKEIKICNAEISITKLAQDNVAGEIVSIDKDKIFVATRDGVLAITEIQPPNKRRMSVAEYLRGHSVILGERFQ
jgi:methionyl-tRNA formyltransferase